MELSDISALASLLRQHGDKILSGNHQLTLTASLLQRLNGAFCMIVEHDANSSFQVIHTTNTKLHDLHFLHDFCQKVEALVISHGSSTLKGNVDISKFRSLRQLELRRVPLHMVSGLGLVQPRLKCITASRSLGRPSDLLGGGEGEPLPPAAWPELRRLSLPHNTLSSLDFSLRLASSLKEVDLSHNQLGEVAGLELLPGLVVLELSYNRLQMVPSLHHQASRTLRALAIAHNQLESLAGVESLNSLRTLHAGWNCLLEPSSLAPLSRLPNLRHLWLEGNPLSRHMHHRERTARRLHPCTSSAAQFMLNGNALSEQERRCVGAACLSLSASSLSPPPSGGDTVRQQGSKEARRGVRVREAVIADLEEHTSPSINTPISLAPNYGSLETSEHLETKRQIETLREKLGDSWLGCVPDVLGLPDCGPTRNEGGSYQRHEAQAWLDSQQRPPPPTKLLSQSPHHSLMPQDMAAAERRHSDSPSEVPSQLSMSPEREDTREMRMPTDLSLALATDSGMENEQINESEDEEDEAGSDPPYLVQREMTSARGDDITKDYFLIVGPCTLVEREACGKSRVVAKWPVDSLQSCERSGPQQVTLAFDTVRRDKQKRSYLLEADDAQRLCYSLGARLEARSLLDMNQAVFHCMRCSAHFSAEISGGTGDGVSRCPSCGSAVVVQEEVESQQTAPPLHPNLLLHSNSQSSIGISTTTAAGKVLVAAEVHPCINTSQIPSKKSSAASLDQSMSDSGLGLALAGRSRHMEGGDSDIEVLSNPSQSSIEVLPPSDDTHSREQSVAPSSELRTGPTSNLAQPKSPIGLTESSSSGSMTDSVCTAYESATSTSMSVGAAVVQPSSSLGRVLGSFLQRLAPPSFLPQPTSQAQPPLQPVSYSYSDFGRVDHRLKLHLCMRELNHENEILTALLRCWILPSSSLNGVPFSGILVLSSQALYIMRITGPEGDNPETWLASEGSWPLSQVDSVLGTCWQFGVSVTLQLPTAKTLNYTLLLGDARHAPGFLAHVAGLVPATCLVKRDMEESAPEQSLPVIAEETASHIMLAANFTNSKKTSNGVAYGPLLVAVSGSELSVSREDLRWTTLTQPDISATGDQHWAEVKLITSLMEVELSSSAPWLLRLRFMEEGHGGRGAEADEEEEWMLWFVSQRARLGVTEALRTPWEKYFEVPLDVRLV